MLNGGDRDFFVKMVRKWVFLQFMNTDILLNISNIVVYIRLVTAKYCNLKL